MIAGIGRCNMEEWIENEWCDGTYWTTDFEQVTFLTQTLNKTVRGDGQEDVLEAVSFHTLWLLFCCKCKS